MIRQLKLGDLVKYDNPEEGFAVERLGYITDIMEFDDGSFPMYEVMCTDPYDRGWFSDLSLKLISKRK